MKTSEIANAVIEKIQNMETKKGRRVISVIKGHMEENAWFSDIDDTDDRTRQEVISNIEEAINLGVDLRYISENNAEEIRSVYRKKR